jgi:phage-related minor tail protein
MAGRIQGITVEIGGDTTKLQTALKGVNTEIRNTQSQLRDVDKLLDKGMRICRNWLT